MDELTYDELLSRGLALYHEGRFEDSYRLPTDNMDKVGGNLAQIYDFRYCMASRMGDIDPALKIMTEAIR